MLGIALIPATETLAKRLAPLAVRARTRLFASSIRIVTPARHLWRSVDSLNLLGTNWARYYDLETDRTLMLPRDTDRFGGSYGEMITVELSDPNLLSIRNAEPNRNDG